MPNREMIHNEISKLLTATATITGATSGVTVDTLGFDSCSFNFHFGATAPAPTSIVINESDDDSTYTAAAAAAVINDGGTHAINTTRRIAYVGNKRYVQAVLTPNGSTIVTITANLGYPERKPTTNPI